MDKTDLIERLKARAEKIRGYIANNTRVMELLQPEMDKFDAREGHNTYTVRIAVDHLSSNRSYTKELADWEDAAATLAEANAKLEKAREALVVIARDRGGTMGEYHAECMYLARATLAELEDGR